LIMAKTRSAKGNAANVPKVEPVNNDDIPIEKEESDAQVATDPIVSVAFKATLDRFRHKDTENHALEAKEHQDYRNGRKRPLNSVIKHEEAHSTATSPSPAKRRRQSSKYAPPSQYAHLPTLVDVLEPNLICVFVGTNPGIRTATSGHAYAHPSNMFWKLLHSSGCTDERLKPEQDVDLPRLYSMGNTNIVERPSKDAAELSKAEMTAGAPILEEKVRKYRPEAVCIVGKGIFEAIWRWRYGKQIKKDQFHYGWQDDLERMGKCDDWEGARIFVSSSTSGLSASTKPHEKEAIWKPFGEWVQARRKERAAERDGIVKDKAAQGNLMKGEIVEDEPIFEEPLV
jgi:mismatch-specific thymine-DNA glycosylase